MDASLLLMLGLHTAVLYVQGQAVTQDLTINIDADCQPTPSSPDAAALVEATASMQTIKDILQAIVFTMTGINILGPPAAVIM